jgi:hypothetical protein
MSRLLTPHKLGSLELRYRIQITPMCQYSALSSGRSMYGFDSEPPMDQPNDDVPTAPQAFGTGRGKRS